MTIRAPSGLEGHAPDRTPLPFEAEGGRFRPCVPDLRRPIAAAGDDPLTVRAERHACHFARVAPQFKDGVPVRASHTLAVRSLLPVTMRVPSGLNVTLYTHAVWPFSSRRSVPVRASHTLAVLSQLPVTIRVPSGLNATLASSSRAPSGRGASSPPARPIPSPTRRHRFGDDARAVRAERHAPHRGPCVPSVRAACVPARVSHTLAVRSSLPVTIRVPSGLNDTL